VLEATTAETRNTALVERKLDPWDESTAATRFACSNAQPPEGRAELFAEQLRLLPGREVAALVDLVEVDEVARVCALGPAARSLVELVREHADGERIEMSLASKKSVVFSQFRPCRRRAHRGSFRSCKR
jgi:hypothetical protein